MGNMPESVKVGTDMITSTSNAQIKKIIQLNTKGKARRNSRAFVVEGVKMFLEAPLDWIEEVYLAESFLEKYQGSKKEEYKQELLEKLETTGYETVSDQVFRHASDTMTPQGILCIVKMPEYRREDLSGGSDQKESTAAARNRKCAGPRKPWNHVPYSRRSGSDRNPDEPRYRGYF